MKKAKQHGYAPLPSNLRSTSPSLGPPPGVAGVLARRGVSPAGEAAARRLGVSKATKVVVAPGQVGTARTSLRRSVPAPTSPPHAHSTVPALCISPPPLPQPAPPGRSRDRFISLPDELQGEEQQAVEEAPPTIFEDLLEEGTGMRGRITVYCVAESIDRKALELRLRERGGAALLHQYPDVLYGLYESTKVGVAGWLHGGVDDGLARAWLGAHCWSANRPTCAGALHTSHHCLPV